MKKTLLFALAGALAVTGFAETAPSVAAEGSATTPGSLERMRDQARADALTSLRLGDLQEVRHTRKHRRRYARSRYSRNRYSLRYVHRRGRWCSKGGWYGRRCTYTPRALKPFRQR